MNPGDTRSGLAKLLEILDRLRIPYMVVGSVASSIHGIVRSTRDVDIVADLKQEDVDALVEELGAEFYSDAETMKSALRSSRAFNLIHLATSYKFDIFSLSADPYDQVQFERRTIESSSQFGPELLEFPVATAEDMVLKKLAWYRAGGEVSERQWSDVRGILEVRRGRLDLDYMGRWAKHLRVDDLLDRAISECR